MQFAFIALNCFWEERSERVNVREHLEKSKLTIATNYWLYCVASWSTPETSESHRCVISFVNHFCCKVLGLRHKPAKLI